MKKFKFLTVALVLVSLLTVFTGCGSSTDASVGSSASDGTSSSGELKTVVIGASGNDGTLTDVAAIAQKEGYFEEELAKVGYKPVYQGFAQAGPAINEAFAGKSIDIAVYGDMPIITANSNGINLKIIATVNSEYSYGVLIGSNSGISSVADLKGKKVAVGFGTVPYKYFVELLQKSGLKISDVEVVNTSSDGPTMLSSNQVDAVVSAASAVYSYESRGIGKVLTTTKDTPDISGLVAVAVRDDFLKENREAAVAFVKALNRAYEFAKSSSDKAYENLVNSSTPLEIQKLVYTDTSFSLFNPKISDETVKKLNSMETFQKSNQLITKDVDINSIVDKTIYEDAVK
jgi:sulfonate transport system substrate-binding protein